VRPIRTLLVALDFSDHSAAALDTAISLAQALAGELHVVHAFDLRIPVVPPYEVAIPEPYIEQSRSSAEAMLAEAAASAREAGVTVHTHLAEGSPASSIAHAAEQVGADLIVMGTRGHTGLKHLVLGSVADRTLRLAHCSVLTVKPSGE
jgi:nucleotide-binding universal stress UspA family protein